MQNLMFIGKMCSGKTTLAKSLEVLGYEVISLADPIKEVVWGMASGLNMVDLLNSAIFDLVPLTDVQKEEFFRIARETKALESEPPKYRERLQFFGTEGGRNRIDRDIWIKCLLAKVNNNPNKLYALDDCRFVNEYESLKDHFIPVLLHLSKDEQHSRLEALYGNYDPKILTHSSELEFELIKARAVESNKALEIVSNFDLDTNTKLLLDKIKGLN